jgi:hypothetical protein
MGFEGLLSRSDELIRHMVEEGYSEGHVRNVNREIDWIRRNGDGYVSYEEACLARESESGSGSPWRGYRTVYGILKRFDLDGELPRRGHLDPLSGRDAYHLQAPGSMEVVGRYGRCAESRGLAEAAACHYRSVTSSFLLAMQGLGRSSLGDVSEDDVLAYFAGESGGPAYSSAVSGPIARVLSSDLGDLLVAPEESDYFHNANIAEKSVRVSRHMRPAIGCVLNHSEDYGYRSVGRRVKTVVLTCFDRGTPAICVATQLPFPSTMELSGVTAVRRLI